MWAEARDGKARDAGARWGEERQSLEGAGLGRVQLDGLSIPRHPCDTGIEREGIDVWMLCKCKRRGMWTMMEEEK